MAHPWAELYRYALRRCQCPESAEDFAQEATLKELNGRHTKIRNLWIDYLRITVAGKPESSTYETRKVFARPIPLEKCFDLTAPDLHELKLETHVLREMTVVERVITILQVKWGMTIDEIGEVLGVSESRVSQITTKLKAKLKNFKDV